AEPLLEALRVRLIFSQDGLAVGGPGLAEARAYEVMQLPVAGSGLLLDLVLEPVKHTSGCPRGKRRQDQRDWFHSAPSSRPPTILRLARVRYPPPRDAARPRSSSAWYYNGVLRHAGPGPAAMIA